MQVYNKFGLFLLQIHTILSESEQEEKKKSKNKLQKKLGLGKLQIFSNEQDVVTYTGKYEAKRILT